MRLLHFMPANRPSSANGMSGKTVFTVSTVIRPSALYRIIRTVLSAINTALIFALNELPFSVTRLTYAASSAPSP